MKKSAALWLTALAVLLAGAPEAKAQDAAINIVVTVDWEGDFLEDYNLRTMENFRRTHSDVPMVHFLNAAYFTKPDANFSATARQIKRVIRPMDEIGLHIHGWKTLFESAGVTFKKSPTFWGGTAEYSDYDYGQDVPISTYSTSELRRVIAFSCNTLEDAGFARPVSFRAGGWYAASNVMSALQNEGFEVEHSAVPAIFLDEVKGTPLYDNARRLWSGTTSLSQPYTFRAGYGRMTQIPNNGALADYMTGDEMLRVFKENVTEFKKNPSKSRVLSIGFHQESAGEFLSRVSNAIYSIKREAKSKGVKINFVTGAKALQDMNL